MTFKIYMSLKRVFMSRLEVCVVNLALFSSNLLARLNGSLESSPLLQHCVLNRILFAIINHGAQWNRPLDKLTAATAAKYQDKLLKEAGKHPRKIKLATVVHYYQECEIGKFLIFKFFIDHLFLRSFVIWFSYFFNANYITTV